MQIISTMVIGLLMVVISCYFGHLINNIFKIKEDNKLLALLVNVAVGLILFIFLVNSFSSILKNFHLGVLLSLVAIIGIGGWQFKETAAVLNSTKEFLFSKFIPLIKETPKSFWILFAIINVVFILTAFTTSQSVDNGLVNNHIFNINQLAIGTYPAKYPHFPSLDLNYHHGAYILSAIVSKLAWAHPEIALDILTILFVNLCFLTIYAMSFKFLGTNNLTRIIVVVSAFFAWLPLSKLISNSSELPNSFLNKLSFIATNRLSDTAELNGSMLHWFFDPPAGFSILFLLIGLYLMYNFFQKEPSVSHTLFIALYISCLSILDLSKFIFVCIGIVIYIALAYFLPSLNVANMNKSAWLKLIAHTGALLFVAIILSVLYGNMLYFSKDYPHIFSLYSVAKSLNSNSATALGINSIMLALFGLGFYLTYKAKEKWCNFLLPFFAVGILMPMFIKTPGNEAGMFFINSSLLGAFVIPAAIEYLRSQSKLSPKNNVYFYAGLAFIFCISSGLYWLFGNPTKPMVSIESGKVAFSGLQNLPYENDASYKDLTKALKGKNARNALFLSEQGIAELISASTGLNNPLIKAGTAPNIKVNQELVKKYINEYQGDYYPTAFAFDSKVLEEQKVSWLILTQKLFRYIMTPTARMKLLNAYINSGANFEFNGVLATDQEEKREVLEAYNIAPEKLSRRYSFDQNKLSEIAKSKHYYISQIAECPYYGIYNTMSNDFNGDNIADIAFFDDANKKWFVVQGGSFDEKETDLSELLVRENERNDVFIPIPGDYDGDNVTDIALFNRNKGFWTVFNSYGNFVTGKSWGGKPGEIPLPGDIDGDGKTDFIAFVADPESPRWPALTSKNNYEYRDSRFSFAISDVPVFADVDGDGSDDYLLYRTNQSQFDTYLSTNDFNRRAPLQVVLGNKSSRIVPADYDGDGKDDLAVWSPESGIWEIAYSKSFLAEWNANKGSQDTPKFVGCGVPPVQDGSPSRGSPVDCTATTFTLGHLGDIPLPGDYNGDGKAEIAVLHTHNFELEIADFDANGNKIVDLSKYKNLIPASFIGV